MLLCTIWVLEVWDDSLNAYAACFQGKVIEVLYYLYSE